MEARRGLDYELQPIVVGVDETLAVLGEDLRDRGPVTSSPWAGDGHSARPLTRGAGEPSGDDRAPIGATTRGDQPRGAMAPDL